MSRARIRKTLDRLAYASLVLDICIAIITTLSIFGESETRAFLIPISYLLTIVVILSLAMFIVLLVSRAKERQALKTVPKEPGPGSLQTSRRRPTGVDTAGAD